MVFVVVGLMVVVVLIVLDCVWLILVVDGTFVVEALLDFSVVLLLDSTISVFAFVDCCIDSVVLFEVLELAGLTVVYLKMLIYDTFSRKTNRCTNFI